MAVQVGMPALLLAGASIVSFCHLGYAGGPGDPAADRTRAVRETYRPVPPTILQVKEPIRVTQCTEQKVPVVVGLYFTDAEGTNHEFSWWLDRGKFQNVEYDRIYWTRYKGPSSIGEKKLQLAVRGPEEDSLYGLLLRYEAAQEKKDSLTLFEKQMLKDVKNLLEKLDGRFAGEGPVPQK